MTALTICTAARGRELAPSKGGRNALSRICPRCSSSSLPFPLPSPFLPDNSQRNTIYHHRLLRLRHPHPRLVLPTLLPTVRDFVPTPNHPHPPRKRFPLVPRRLADGAEWHLALENPRRGEGVKSMDGGIDELRSGMERGTSGKEEKGRVKRRRGRPVSAGG